MANIPIPFVDMNLSTDDPTGMIFTFVMIVLGFAALFWARDLGFSVKNTVAQTTGVGASGNNDQNQVELI
jgi:hypothetical protein